MKLYNKNTVCVKCGEAAASTRWCRNKLHSPDDALCRVLHAYGDVKHISIKNQHMERVCKNCGFGWLERPMDAGAPLEQLAAQAEWMPNDMPTYPEWLEAKLPYFPLGTLWAYGDDVVEILDHERDNYLELTGHCRCRVVRTGQICYPDYQELDDVSPLRALAGAAE